jgi:hypothetical protein
MSIKHKSAYLFTERPQNVLSKYGYGLCSRHFYRFWNNPPEANREWHIAIKNYEDAHSSGDIAFVNFVALSFQMARISILRFRCLPDDAARFAATALLLVDALEYVGKGEAACAALLEALNVIQDCEDIWLRSSVDFEFIASQMVVEARTVHRKYNTPKHLQLVWSNPQRIERH